MRQADGDAERSSDDRKNYINLVVSSETDQPHAIAILHECCRRRVAVEESLAGSSGEIVEGTDDVHSYAILSKV